MDIRGTLAAHAHLVAAVAALTDEQVVAASLLPGWTVGHVLAHLARNAESHVAMLRAANAGQVGVQYPGGAAQRTRDIDAGASRSAAEQVADLIATNAQLEAAWAAMTEAGWNGQGQSALGAVAMHELPFRRWRETVVHHADLGLGYTWHDWPGDYVRLELTRMTMLWSSRQPMGLTTLPAAAVVLPDHERLAWLMGRTEVTGLAAAGIL